MYRSCIRKGSGRHITVREGHRSSKAKARASKACTTKGIEAGILIRYYHETGGDTDANVQGVLLWL